MSKPKLLWCGDAACPTGFARVTHSILDRIQDKFEIVIMGVNYDGNPHDYPYKIYPAGAKGDIVGRNRVKEIALHEKADIIVLFSDIWIVFDWWQEVKDLNIPVGAYFPLDGHGFYPKTFDFLEHLAFAATYTNFGVEGVRHARYEGKVEIIGHGVDTKTFHPVSLREKNNIREKYNVPKDAFVVIQANRNQERKRMDLTIKAFAKFLKRMNYDPRIRFHFHCGRKDAGWPILALCEREMGEKYAKHVTMSTQGHYHPNLESSVLNDIYNTADIGINTSMGEGAGLVAMELAACGIPSVLPKHSANPEFFEGAAYLVPIESYITDLHFGIERALIDLDLCVEFLVEAYEDSQTRRKLGEVAYQRLKTEPRFNWDAIAKKMTTLLDQALCRR